MKISGWYEAWLGIDVFTLMENRIISATEAKSHTPKIHNQAPHQFKTSGTRRSQAMMPLYTAHAPQSLTNRTRVSWRSGLQRQTEALMIRDTTEFESGLVLNKSCELSN